MNTSKILINILIALLVLVAIWLGYKYLFSADEGASPTIATTTNSASDADVEGGTESEFVQLLKRLRDVELDASFLKSLAFSVELEDYSVNLSTLPRGRRNPFGDFGTGNFSADQDLSNSNSPSVDNEGAPAQQSEGGLIPKSEQEILDSLQGIN